jgi:heat-inducible transcriptional repressor
MVAEFNERRQLILKLVVQEFIETANAVASETLVRKHQLAVSPATVRNELAALEELGYLTHLHTSAGRVPTNAGYRFFVENLMDYTPLSPGEQDTIRRQFYQVRGEFDQWIQLGATVLARTAQNASVITPPQAYRSRFRHLELIAIHDTVILLVLVLHDGTVRQQTITTETVYTQEELRYVSASINERCDNETLDGVEMLPGRLKEPQAPHLENLRQHVLELVVRSMRQLEDSVNRQIYSDGLMEMLSQPEFIPSLLKEEDTDRAIERMRQVLETFTNSNALGSLIVQALASDDVQVIIGEEHGKDEMRDYSVVLSRYGVSGMVVGVLGIVGPTRMAYPRSISTVRYMSSVLSDLLGELYGTDADSPNANS